MQNLGIVKPPVINTYNADEAYKSSSFDEAVRTLEAIISVQSNPSLMEKVQEVNENDL